MPLSISSSNQKGKCLCTGPKDILRSSFNPYLNTHYKWFASSFNITNSWCFPPDIYQGKISGTDRNKIRLTVSHHHATYSSPNIKYKKLYVFHVLKIYFIRWMWTIFFTYILHIWEEIRFSLLPLSQNQESENDWD